MIVELTKTITLIVTEAREELRTLNVKDESYNTIILGFIQVYKSLHRKER